jgi:hypothetical protein
VIELISDEYWQQLAALLPASRAPGEPVIPRTAVRAGRLHHSYDYVLCDAILSCIGDWMRSRGETHALYFLTEVVSGQDATFRVSSWDLNEETLASVNGGFENVITATDFSWAVFVDHEGVAHVAGPEELFTRLRDCEADMLSDEPPPEDRFSP